MLITTLDPFKQLAVQGPAVAPSAPSTRLFSAGGGLLTERHFELPAAYKRALSFTMAHRVLMPRPGTSFATELGFFIDPAAESVIREQRRAPSTLREQPTMFPARAVEAIPLERDALPFLMGVRRFIEAEQVPAARKMLEAAPVHILSDPLVARLRSVLAPPVVERVQKRDVDRSLEYEWLRTEGYKYRGRWVALEGKNLLAVASSLRDLREQLRSMPLTRPPLLHRLN